MSTARRLLIVVGVVAMAAGPIAAFADPEEDAENAWHEMNENWPEEVPTPWFCIGNPPVGVCVPPW